MKKVLVINETSLEEHIGSKTVISNIHTLCTQNNMQVIGTLTRKEIERWIPRIKQRLRKTDIVIINGEGSLHDSPDWFSFLIDNIIRDKRKLFEDKKIVLINSLWQNMDHGYMDRFLDRLDLITLRESLSYNELIKDYRKDDKISVVPDLIFALDQPPSIGYGDSVVEDIRDKLKKRDNYLPMNFIKNMPDVYSYMSWLKSLELYVTGRFHGVCLSILTKTPFLAIPSNSHKIEGILKDMNCEGLLIKSAHEIKVIKHLAKKAIPKMEIYNKDAKEKINNLFKQIGEL